MIFGLTEELKSMVEEKASSIVSDFVISNLVEKNNVPLEISKHFTVQSISENIITYFNSLKTEDLFFEINELLSNAQIIDKQQLYLYFLDLKFESAIYPLFYVSVTAEKNANTITLTPEPVVYINKKALDYVVENYNLANNKKGKIKSAEIRALHIAESDVDLEAAVDDLANEIMNYFEMNGLFEVAKHSHQGFRGKSVGLSNSCYLALFDKADESLVNDYEELITILNSTKSGLANDFCLLLNGFLKDEPIKINSQIEKQWENTDVPSKLVTVSPIPLNEEQNQIISALKNDGCKYIVVEGPPGTGKSHSITAIVFNSILEGKSVLVLSDKTEALDVVENKITDTLNNVRLSDEFQNPILRLGKSGNTYNKILSTESLSNIKNHHKVVSQHQHKLAQQIELANKGLKNTINAEITEYSKVNLQDIIQIEKLEMGEKSW
jgi:hypothetical protein